MPDIRAVRPDSPLFTPFVHGSLRLSSRIVMAPMGRGVTVDGVPVADYGPYYRRRIEGGAGLIISESTAIGDPAAGWDDSSPHFFGAEALASWRQIAAQVHAAGGAMIPQLWHTGMQRETSRRDPALQPIGPSALWLPPAGAAEEGRPVARGEPMSAARIDGVIAAYGAAAAAARTSGFDGVEIHMAHGYLIDQFLWSRTNLRDDRFGGGAVERTRFAVEVLREVRRAVGPGFPILARISQFKMSDYAARLAETPAELEALLTPLAQAGVDIFDCSQRRFWEPEFPGDDRNLAGWTKAVTGRPTITVGSVGVETQFALATVAEDARPSTERLALLEDRLERGDFDLVAVGRALLADAQWPRKIRERAFDALVPYSAAVLGGLT